MAIFLSLGQYKILLIPHPCIMFPFIILAVWSIWATDNGLCSHSESVHLFSISKRKFPMQGTKKKSPFSPVENKNDLELDFKVFFFTDSCCSDIVHDESN